MKRKPTSTQGKPVLDEGAFRQLLAAGYILQEHHDRLLKEPKADCAALCDGATAENVRPIQQMVPLTPERVAIPVLPLEPVIPKHGAGRRMLGGVGIRFATRDDSNNWFVALLTFGEGWHNNHHAHPTSARHGLKWYEIDMNWYGIWTLKMFGLATQIKRVGAIDLVRKEILADGNMTRTGARHLQSAAGD